MCDNIYWTAIIFEKLLSNFIRAMVMQFVIKTRNIFYIRRNRFADLQSAGTIWPKEDSFKNEESGFTGESAA